MWKSFPGIICNTITLRLLQYYLILNEKKLPIQFQKNVSPFNGSMLLRTFAGIVYEQCFCAMQHVHPIPRQVLYITLFHSVGGHGGVLISAYTTGEN